MVDGFELDADILEEPSPRECQAAARALAADGLSVIEIALRLDRSPLTAWWLTDYAADRA